MSNHAPKVDSGAKLVFVLSALALLGAVYILVMSLINTYEENSTKGVITSASKIEKAAGNLKPIGVSATSDAPVETASKAARSGKEVYAAVCQVCHTAGIAGAPKLGDKAIWEPRVATGLDSLMNVAINGKGAMPARGGNPAVTDDELKATIIYMVKEAGFDLGGAAAPAEAVPAKKEEVAKVEAPKVEVAKVEVAKVEAPKVEAPKEKEAATEKTEVKVEVAAATETPETKVEEIKAPEVAAEPATPSAPAAPVVAVEPATPKKPEAPVDLAAGKKVYNTICFACHKTGVAGSPILGDKKVWEPRIATGTEALYDAVIKGKGGMPPKGGNMSMSDDDAKAAVDYMISESR